MLVLLPSYHGQTNLADLKLRVDYLKELGASNRGLFYHHGFIFEFPDHLFNEWHEILGIVPFI